MDLPAKLIESFNNVPVNEHLGFKLILRTPESAIIDLEPRPELIQEAGVIHGAVLAALADTSAVYPFLPDLPVELMMTSIEFKLNFLSPALLDGGKLTAQSKVVRKGRTVGVCDVEVSQGKRLIAKGLFTYLFFPRIMKTQT
jgi:uncharacterized protein (TIGR00369 family)